MGKEVLFAFAIWGLGLCAGWMAAEWRRDSVELVTERAAGLAADKARSELQGVASESARALEVKLEELKGAIPDGLRTEVVKPVFTNVCVSDDFVRMYNEASEKAERTLSGKFKN
ncbi:hypothetical protein [Mixta mediterraneensis]|uniref:hypothetical protein n=1 Tax=Mixta mediterraneensis TaxID=2758443 RepID=UPI001875594A|nr:hypothetical protein [Mixta mediterraneensis]MBE5254172.1 hypothetical protein [Mixta mediterraneensis]